MQIPIEFINENFENVDVETLNKMISQENTPFKAIMTRVNLLLNGEIVQNDYTGTIEKDYILNELDSSEINDDSPEANKKIFSNSLFSSLTHYLKLFENNLDFDIFGEHFLSIKEMFIYMHKEEKNYPDKKYLTYCKNLDNDNGLIESIFSKRTFPEIIKEINLKKNSYIPDDYKTIKEFQDYIKEPNYFADYITRNDFLENINQLNLIKFKTFNLENGGIKYNFLLGLRLDKDSMISLFNKQHSNMTTILPVTDLTVENANLSMHDLHLMHDNQYFLYFFEYGIKNILELIPLKISSQMSDEIDYLNTNIKIFLEILQYSYLDKEELKTLYNEMWENEFKVILQLIKRIIGEKYFPTSQCDEDEDKANIMCKINEDSEKLDNYTYNITFGDIPEKDNNDPNFGDLTKTVFFIHKSLYDTGRCTVNYSLMQNVFIDLEAKKSNVKIIYYNRTTNNLIYHNIEVLNFTTYNIIIEEFIQEMDGVQLIVIILRFCFTFLFFLISLYKIIKEVSNAIKRINAIISLKDMLFYKTELKYEDMDNDELNEREKIISQRTSLSAKDALFEDINNHDSSSDGENEEKRLLYDNENELQKKKDEENEKWSKAHVYDPKFFEEGNEVIIKYTYNRLKTIFENMDNYQNEKFTEKLVFLKRRYKLNEQNEDKEDCELSSDIYQAISKIRIIDMNDIFYNVYYNQSYALSQSFKMFKSILDSSINKQSIPQRNNKFINFGRILKIIYYFKKEKIQKIIEIIFDKDLKYKQQQLILKKENTADIIMKNQDHLNTILNLTAQVKKKDGHRRSFIEMEKD